MALGNKCDVEEADVKVGTLELEQFCKGNSKFLYLIDIIRYCILLNKCLGWYQCHAVVWSDGLGWEIFVM